VLGLRYGNPPQGGWVYFDSDGTFMRHDIDSSTCVLSTYRLECTGTCRGTAKVEYCKDGEQLVLSVPVEVLSPTTIKFFAEGTRRLGEANVEGLKNSLCPQTGCQMFW